MSVWVWSLSLRDTKKRPKNGAQRRCPARCLERLERCRGSLRPKSKERKKRERWAMSWIAKTRYQKIASRALFLDANSGRVPRTVH